MTLHSTFIYIPCSGSKVGVLTGSGELGGVPGVLTLLEPQRAKMPFLTGVGAVSSFVSSSSITEKHARLINNIVV